MLLSAAFVFFPTAPAHPQNTPISRQTAPAPLTGIVVDPHGKPVPTATVTLQARNGDVASRTTQTDAAGRFTFPDTPAAAYTLRATKGGIGDSESTIQLTANAPTPQRLVLTSVPASSANPGLLDSSATELSDKPNFAVAGVTDWTAVGGHGSDAVLRTSESLARDTAALSPAPSSPGAAPRTPQDRATEAALQKAVAADPQSLAANRNLGLVYLGAHNPAAALAPLTVVANAPGHTPNDDYQLALACRGIGDLGHARQAVGRALASDPNRAAFHRLDAQLAEQLGDPLAAVQQQQRATELDGSEENIFDLGSEFLLHRAIWQAAQTFADGARIYPASGRLRTGWGAALFAGARYDDAARKLCAASDLDPANQQPYRFMGRIAAVSSELDPCVREKLERFVRFFPNDAQPRYFLAMLLLRDGGKSPADTTRATQLLHEAIARDPNDAEAYLQLGILAFAHRDYPAAIDDYQHALAADSSLGEAHYRLAVAYDRTGQPNKAKAEFAQHDQLEQQQAAQVEQQRREIKQFVVAASAHP